MTMSAMTSRFDIHGRGGDARSVRLIVMSQRQPCPMMSRFDTTLINVRPNGFDDDGFVPVGHGAVSTVVIVAAPAVCLRGGFVQVRCGSEVRCRRQIRRVCEQNRSSRPIAQIKQSKRVLPTDSTAEVQNERVVAVAVCVRT